MWKRDTTVAIYALIIIVLATQAAAFLKVDIDAGVVTMTALTAIAALVRGEGGRREEPPKVP